MAMRFFGLGAILDAIKFRGSKKRGGAGRLLTQRRLAAESLENRVLLSITTMPPHVAPQGLAAGDVSATGVRYANGDVVLSTDDLYLGSPTRSYSADGE